MGTLVDGQKAMVIVGRLNTKGSHPPVEYDPIKGYNSYQLPRGV